MPRIDVITIPTRSRPRSLKQALQSITMHLMHHGRQPEVAVFDASPSAECRKLNFDVVRVESGKYGGILRYFGLEQKSELSATLAFESGIERDITDFCLSGLLESQECFGSNRNHILLTFTDSLLLSTDDDVMWRPAWPHPSSAKQEYAVRGDEVVTETSTCINRKDTLTQLTSAQDCILDCHEQVLGQEISSILSRLLAHCKKLTVFAPCSHLQRSLEQGEGTIVMSHSGIYGDSGMDSPFRPLCFPGGGKGHLNWDNADLSREVIAAAPAVTLSHAGPWMATNCGLDNRGMLPPYFPTGRKEDGITGTIVRQCNPHGYFAHLPMSLLHSPPEPRQYPKNWLENLVKPRLSDALLCAIASFKRSYCEENQQIQFHQLGTHLRNMAQMGSDELCQMLETLWRKVLTARLSEIEDQRKKMARAPTSWQNLADSCAASLAAGITATSASGMDKCGTVDCSLAKLLDLYGRLLIAWRHLAGTAKKLHGQILETAHSPGKSRGRSTSRQIANKTILT